MAKRDFCTINDFSTKEIQHVLDMAIEMKKEVPSKQFVRRLDNQVLAMIFEKPSLRTRCTFEIAMTQMGGTSIYLGPSEIGLGKRESIYDIAKNLERWFDIVMIRTFEQSNIEEMASHCTLPIINALSDDAHPCQAMADFQTLLEKRGSFDGMKLAYLGDGNNICHSLIDLSMRLGVDMRVAGPNGFQPCKKRVAKAKTEAEKTGAKLLITTNAVEAVQGVDAIYTDVWASMGQEDEAEDRKAPFMPYQLNAALAAHASDGAYIMHDLPAHRGEEITDDMMDCPTSIVFDQAENRLHAQKAVMVFLSEQRG